MKKVKKKSKFVVKEISPEELKARWSKKKLAIQTMSENIQKLRYNVSRDLKSDDEKVFLTALVVVIMDKTAERIGNDASAKEGHLGVTGFSKKNVAVIGNKVILEYTGKSGVQHHKYFSDERIAKSLKKSIKNAKGKFVFTTSDGFRIKRERVNRYLSDFGVTAKDIRGYSSNKMMVNRLNKVEIADNEKDRKKQFLESLRWVAKKVGHGSGTLRSHYLIPELEQSFIKSGKIIDISDVKTYEDGGKITNDEKVSKNKNVDKVVKKEGNMKKEYDPDQVKMGKKIELEHTKTIEYLKKHPETSIEDAAEMIAKDHLDEMPDYYTHIMKIESTVENKEEGGSVAADSPKPEPNKVNNYVIDIIKKQFYVHGVTLSKDLEFEIEGAYFTVIPMVSYDGETGYIKDGMFTIYDQFESSVKTVDYMPDEYIFNDTEIILFINSNKSEDMFFKGGQIEFDKRVMPKKYIYEYAKKIKTEYPEIWKKGGNIRGNDMFRYLELVVKRGHWLNSEEKIYIKWQSFIARHKRNYRIEGVVAMLKWVGEVEYGFDYMKSVIEEEIKKSKQLNTI